MRSSTPPTYVEIDLAALRNNLRVICEQTAPAKVLGVVKADAYGHGAVRCAQALEEEGVDYLGVALAQEGAELRRAGIRIPILVFGGLAFDDIDKIGRAHV